MKPAERDKIIQETHQALLGIPGTEDFGLVGDVKEVKADVKKINNRVTTVEALQEERNKPSKKTVAGYISVGAALAVALWKAFTGS